MGERGHILHVFPGFGHGGAELRTCDLINHFGDKFRFTIASLNGDQSAAQRIQRADDLDFLRVPPHNPRNILGSVRLFSRLLRDAAPDLLITHNWGATDWAIANAIRPVCPHLHVEDGFNDDEAVGQKIRRILVRRIFLSRAFAVVVPSTTLLTVAVDTWGLARRQVRYLPNGVDLQRFGSVPIRRDNDRVIIGTVGGLRRVKNQERLVRVFSAIPPDFGCVLWIVGEGDRRAALESYIRSHALDDRVRLLGRTEHPEEHLSRLDIFCLSSDSEQMPISLLEAMAAACPVVSTDVGDVKEMVAPGNRPFIVGCEEDEHFTQALVELVRDRDLRERLGAQNRGKCLREYRREVMLDAWEHLYREAMAARPGR